MKRELRQYWHPTKGGWHVGIVESERQTKDGPVFRIRPIKPAVRCLDVQAKDTKVVTTDEKGVIKCSTQ